MYSANCCVSFSVASLAIYVRMFLLTLGIVWGGGGGGGGQTRNTLFHQICLRPKAVCSVSVYDTTAHSHNA